MISARTVQYCKTHKHECEWGYICHDGYDENAGTCQVVDAIVLVLEVTT